MEIRGRIGPVSTARSAHYDVGAGLHAARPRSGDTLVTVHDEVDPDLASSLVDPSHRVGADRCVLPRGKFDLDVAVGVGSRGEVAEAVPAEDDPHEVFGDRLRAQHGQGRR